MDKFIFKLIHDDETKDSFRLSVEHSKEHDFIIKILKKSNAWAARVKYENICFQARQLEIGADEYFTKLQEYLRNAPTNVTLKFSNNEFIINCTLENNMKIKYFSCRLEKVSYCESVEELLEKFYTERNKSLETLITIYKEKSELEKSNNNFQLKLNEFIERKKTDDEELYSNFVLVLNEKKKRIQHLTELLEAFRRGRSTINPSVDVKKRSKKKEPPLQLKSEPKEAISESDSEEGYDTDDDKSKRPQKLSENENKNDIYAMPSTSKFDLFDDDSPPRHLPKRIKSEIGEDNDSHIKPSTSKQSSKSKNENENSSNKSTQETPDVNFSTQELLDTI